MRFYNGSLSENVIIGRLGEISKAHRESSLL